MSRIGKKPVAVPKNVRVTIANGAVSAEGPKGKVVIRPHSSMAVREVAGDLLVYRPDDSRVARSLHGLTRTLVQNAVSGVSIGFTRDLDVSGVGYRAEVKGSSLHMNLGFSHPVVYQLPDGVSAVVDEKRTHITLKGVDKQLLGSTAAKIRSFRPPEPYGGKGIRYSDEKIQRKEGKSGAK